MSDQAKLAALSDGPTANIVRSAGAVRSFQRGGHIQVVRNKDDPYLAGMSEDHRRVYIDKRVPRQITVRNKTFDPSKYLVVHETIERRHMDRGMKYEVAHRLALKAERAAVEADGINWNGYQGQMHRLAGITEKEKHVHPPRDLYKGPFSRREQNKLTKEGDTAPDIVGSTKSYAEGGEVTGDQDRAATPDEMEQYGLDPNGPGRQATPEEMQQYKLDPNGPPDYSVAGEALKRGAQAVLPGLGSIPGMVAGSELGAAAGTAIFPGPGTIAGGLVGAAAGGIASNVSLRKLQDWFLDKLGMTPDQAKAEAFQQEHPTLAAGADIAGSLVGMSPGGAATTLAQRGGMAAGQAAIEAGSEYLHTGELDPSDIAMAAAAGAAFPGLNKIGEPLGQLGNRLASKVGVRAGRPDMNPGPGKIAVPAAAPPDFTTSAEGETAAYPGGDDQVFSQAAAPRPGTARENERPIYEMPRSEWTSIPGTRPPNEPAPGAENEIQSTKNEEDILADKQTATPAHAGYDPNSTLSTSHEVPPPAKKPSGNPQSYPVSDRENGPADAMQYKKTPGSNVEPNKAEGVATAETLDQNGLSQELTQALTQDNGPGRNTPPRGLKAADKRMQQSMRVPFEGKAANENEDEGLNDLLSRGGGGARPTDEEMVGGEPEAPSTARNFKVVPLPELEARRGGEPTKEELEGVPPTPENVRSLPAPKNTATHPEIGAVVKGENGTLSVHTGEGNYQPINTKKGSFTAVRIPSETEIIPAADKNPKNILTDESGTFRPFEYMRAEKKTETYKIYDHNGNHVTDIKVGVVGNRAYILGKGMDELGTGPMRVLRQQLQQYYPDLKQVIKPPKGFFPETKPVEKPSDTGIVEGAVTDTAAKLRKYDLPDVAEAVEKNPSIEPQARRILQDLSTTIEEKGSITPEELDRVSRIMGKIENKEIQGVDQIVKQGDQRASLGGGEETVATATVKEARQKQFAAQAAQTAFENHPPTDNKIPTTQVDKDLFVRRLSNALETAKSENLGKDPLARVGSKRTAAQEWLKAAQKIVNAKRASPKMISDFIKNETMMRGGAQGKEIREFNKVDEDIAFNKRRVTEDPIDTAMRQWTESLSPEDRAQWENELSNTSDPNGDEYQHETSAGRKAGLEDYDSQKSSGADYYGGLLRDMFRDDAGIFRPQAFLASLRGIFGPKARLYAESYRARAPEGIKEEYARSVDDGLNRVQKMEGGVWLDKQRDAAAMPATIKDNDEKIYLAHERDDIASLSPDEKQAYYQKLQPVFEENDHLFRQIEQIHTGLLGPKVENHIQRIPQGYHPDFGGDPIANVTAARNKRGLSTMTGTLKHREFMALEDPQGNRKVISPTENGYAEWNNHVSAQRQNAAFEDKPGVQFRDHNGVLQTVKDALTPEIEANANFSNGQPAKYVKSSILSALSTNAELRNTLSRLQYLESLKGEMVAQGMATDNKEQAERHVPPWKKTVMPQFDKYYMNDHLRAALDDFAAPGLTHGEAWDKVRALSEKVTKLMFVDPVFHLANVGTHWFTDRGWDWIKPEKMRTLAVTSAQAIKSVLNQDLLQDTLYEHGFGGQYRGVLNQNRLMNIYTAAGHAIASNPSQWDPIARVVGMSAKDLGAAVYRASSKVMWAGNDIFLTQRVLERMHDGANMENAIMQSEKHFPNYRVPSYIIGANGWGRFASQALRDNTLFAFGPYHYGVFNSYAHIVKDAVKGNGQERIDAVGKMFAMGLLAFAVYPALDKIARLATGNEDAEFRRRGPLTLPNHIVRAAQFKEDALNTGPQGTMTISPLAQGVMQQGANRDFAGRPINPPGDVGQAFQGPNRMQALGRLVTQRAASMAQNFISPYAMASRAVEDAQGPLRGLIAQVADIKNPSPAAMRHEREAAAIEKQKSELRQRPGRGLSWEENLYNRATR